MSATLGERLAGAARPVVYVDTRVDLAHRRLLATAATDIAYGLVEALLAIIGPVPPFRSGDQAHVGHTPTELHRLLGEASWSNSPRVPAPRC